MRKMKIHKIIRNGLFGVLALGIILLVSFPSLAGEWHKNERGWWYTPFPPRDRNSFHKAYYVNTWAFIENDHNAAIKGTNTTGKLYNFDENGYLRTNQITPDGYYVNTDGALSINEKAIEACYYTKWDMPAKEEWSSGSEYIGRWISIGFGNFQTYDPDHPDDILPAPEGEISPYEIEIERDANGNMYANLYNLQNGNRTKTDTFDFLHYQDEKYIINMGKMEEIFYLVSSTLCSMPSNVEDATMTQWELPCDYYLIVE